MFDGTNDIHVIRDAKRGGVGTVLYEIAGQSGVGITLDAEKIPVADEVKGVCGMLGLEPLYLACEGRLVLFAPKDKAEDIVSALRKCKNSENAAVIGEVTEDNAGRVVMKTEIGSQTFFHSRAESFSLEFADIKNILHNTLAHCRGETAFARMILSQIYVDKPLLRNIEPNIVRIS